jgi:NAD(P)H-dependent FMN reductase
MPKLLVVIASVREGRVGKPVADWFLERAREHGGFEIEVADLKELDLPLMSEPNHPSLGKYTQDVTRAWSATVGAADAFVFVSPEYNYSVPPPLSNAISYLNAEWKYKALGLVSYGGVSAGTRSTTDLRGMIGALGMYQVVPAVNIPFARQKLEDGRLVANEIMNDAVPALLDELLKVDAALRTLRD